MKKIKIQPMFLAENLKPILKVNSEQKITRNDETKGGDLLLLQKLMTENRGKGHIMAKSMPGFPATIVSNILTKDNHPFQFPEPNPVHLYFQNACIHLENGKELLAGLKQIDSIDHNAQYIQYCKYFYEVSDGISQLITSIEAFVNQIIPEGYSLAFIDDSDNSKNEIWEKETMIWKDLKTKIKTILTAYYQKSFLETNKQEYDNLMTLQRLRNDLIHLKAVLKNNFTFYETLMAELLDFEPDKFVNSAFVFLNYYLVDFIQEEA